MFIPFVWFAMVYLAGKAFYFFTFTVSVTVFVSFR